MGVSFLWQAHSWLQSFATSGQMELAMWIAPQAPPEEAGGLVICWVDGGGKFSHEENGKVSDDVPLRSSCFGHVLVVQFEWGPGEASPCVM